MTNAAKLRKQFDRQKGECTWCGKPVPKGSRTWCSDECVTEFRRKHDWQDIRKRVVKRDGDICAQCGFDGNVVKRIIGHLRCPRGWAGYKHLRDFYRTLGYDNLIDDLMEVHHIVSRVNGGGHDLENLQTLCVACHKAETRRLAKERAAARRDSN